ncbi:hypothetical protein H7X46_17085 [Pseudonocardia sp. C8]|uniref:hypothetical protein n=1 Tax=Pseudonocardia sp. C8 TaxID=2762759 RepID=UPI0016434F68|nr:hypothetical protein [Pseudonocardia sp. C8]MBC3192782.1 hypothetical protein [Pseudonocardia sp. C8]
MRLAPVLVALLVAAGCAAGPPETGLTGAVMQYRSDIAARVLTVRLRAGNPVTVERVQLRPAGFVPSPPVTPGTALGAGTTADIRIPLEAPDCAATAGESTAVVTAGGAESVLVLADAHGAVGALQRAECAERAVRDRAGVTFGPVWTRDGDRLRGTVRLHRRAGTGPVAVTELGGTTIFGIRPAGGRTLPLTLGGADVVLPVEVVAARCDPHALAESKRATAFTVVAAVPASPPARLTVTPDDREPLLTFAADRCRGQ